MGRARRRGFRHRKRFLSVAIHAFCGIKSSAKLRALGASTDNLARTPTATLLSTHDFHSVAGHTTKTSKPSKPQNERTLARHQGSADLARTIEGVRCRINLLRTSRGVGVAIRLLAALVPTIDTLNLHPDLKKLSELAHGLVIVSGPTGCGKSSTIAALIQQINESESRHIITLEAPIEYQFEPQCSFIRQREVGHDVPSMQQGVNDAMREDPDVLMVGEMREPETMRATLNAAETGHLVFSTIHSATCVEALERVNSAFPAEIQSSVASQLAECLIAVVCQRLRFHKELGIRLPECEILRPTEAVKNFILRGELRHIASALETGAESGMWTFTRYRTWMDARSDWYVRAK